MTTTIDHYLNPIARFADLKAGDRFTFPHLVCDGVEKTFERTKSGYRQIVPNRSPVFRTGNNVAVIPQ